MRDDSSARSRSRDAADRYGALIDADGGERTRISGAIVQNLREAMIEVAGAPVVDSALERIPSAARIELIEALPISWVSLRSVEYLLHGIADVSRSDVYALNRDVNRRGAERTFTTMWRMMLRLASVDLLFSRSQAYFSRTYDRGRLDARILFPGRAQLEIRGRPGMSRMAREGFAVGVETLLRCGGRHVLRAQSEPHADGAVCMLAWQP
jgi:hypothetical protein